MFGGGRTFGIPSLVHPDDEVQEQSSGPVDAGGSLSNAGIQAEVFLLLEMEILLPDNFKDPSSSKDKVL